MCLAGTLEPFRPAAADILLRFSGIRLGASTVRSVTRAAGSRLAQRQRAGDIVVPAEPADWDFALPAGHTHSVAYLGLDAFSVPVQKPKGVKTEYRMLYTAVLYTPGKEHSHYLADFELDSLAAQMRQAAVKLGLGRANQLVAITDGGNGLEEALRRNFDEGLTCILDWYHASQHLHEYGKCVYGEAQGAAWAEGAKGVLYERGGTALLARLRGEAAPEGAEAAEEYRKLVGYFSNNEHRSDYPSYRAHGWDLGSGPTEAACKRVGARLKGSGMRWSELGAAEVVPLRALYLSGTPAWDAFFAQAS